MCLSRLKKSSNYGRKFTVRTGDLRGAPDRLVVHVVLMVVLVVLPRGIAHHVNGVDQACNDAVHVITPAAASDRMNIPSREWTAACTALCTAIGDVGARSWLQALCLGKVTWEVTEQGQEDVEKQGAAAACGKHTASRRRQPSQRCSTGNEAGPAIDRHVSGTQHGL
jgi:hypothetical protein